MITIVSLFFLLIPIVSFSTTVPTQIPGPMINVQDINSRKLPPTREAKWNALIGTWFGSIDTRGGGKYMWISTKNNDGKYNNRFRTVDRSGRKKDKVETGEWGVSGDVYFTIYKADIVGDRSVPVSTTNPANRDAYRILNLTNEVFEYEHLENGHRFVAKKVAPDFKFPE